MSCSGYIDLQALLSAFVVAAPSPAGVGQQPLVLTSNEPTPLWKSFSNRLIGAIWGSHRNGKDIFEHRYPSALRQSSQPPPRTLARYSGDVVVRFNVSTAEEASSLAEAADTLFLDVWGFSHDWVDIRLAKTIVPSFLRLLPSSLRHKHTPLLGQRDLAQAIYDTYPVPRDQSLTPTPSAISHLRVRPLQLSRDDGDNSDTNVFFTNYQPLSVITPWLHLLASLFTTHVRLLSIGTTYEGRPIPALRIGVHPTNNDDPNPPKRKTVLITGGVHAREWISTSTVNYIAYSLITRYGKNPSTTKLLEDFDFVLVPTLNPDGYVYSWDTDRLWRKNRQRTGIRFCQGIDLDRGYGFEWDAVSTAGNPCSENFAGDSAFEAVESKRLADWAKNETERNNVEIVGFLDLHAYSQQILYPYSYSCSPTTPNQENLEELAVGLEKAIRRSSGLKYEVLAACEGNSAISSRSGEKELLPLMEGQGGSALDWFYHEMGVRYAYQIKLRDRGTYGFLLPREEIVPTGKEILAAAEAFGGFLQGVYVGQGAGKGEVEEEGVEDEEMVTTEMLAGDEGDDEGLGDDDPWVIVEDLVEEEILEEPQWDLRRRRRR
ncbi:putative metallocarboxypeptidase ecm14 [Saxophila tyrrhenica]|uniref:Inactive metallocarboxypeptidase ECM14 n=1 Tax=Saxophila tyrrhenica TaxID=1690608 RepID=A0AAV9PL17_9PEZI|nr:putative metallocarboxypeptidase ecm14 [Saxophila tyrrhenica]